MTGEEQIQSVERQIREITRGKSVTLGEGRIIKCPYCGELIIFGDPLCCLLLANAMAAVLIRLEWEDRKEIAEEVMEKAGKN
jgi:hypothetical protein